MEHLQPQTPLSNLVQSTQSNYSIAQNYYSQRRDAFRYFLWRNGVAASQIEEDISVNIEKIWNEKIFNVVSGIYWAGRKSGLSVEEMQKQIESRFNLSPEVMKHLLYAIKQGNPRTFYSGLGFAFEQWLEEQGVGAIINRGQQFAEAHQTNLINTFVSGALKSKASAVSGIKNIRSDILITSHTTTDFRSDDGVLKTPTGLPMELQSTLTVDWNNAVPNPDEIMSDHSILEEFLKPGLGDFYGLSAKSWSNSDGKEFMQSSVMQKMLNATFNQTDSEGQRHSWQPDYTMEYVVYFLSHRIFDIIGPTTVGLVSRQGFTWMDDFLSQHIFYMQVQLERFWKKKDGGLGRIYPQITNPGVYVRNYNIGTATAFKAKKHKTKSQGNYIDLKVI